MTEGNGKRIGSIGWLWQRGKVELHLDHVLHLVFASRAGANDCQLDFLGGVLKHGDLPFCGGDQHSTACHPELECTLHIFINELGFYRNSLWLECCDEVLNRFENDKVPVVFVCRSGWPDGTKIERLPLLPFCTDDTVAGDMRPRINAEDSFLFSVRQNVSSSTLLLFCDTLYVSVFCDSL